MAQPIRVYVAAVAILAAATSSSAQDEPERDAEARRRAILEDVSGLASPRTREAVLGIVAAHGAPAVAAVCELIERTYREDSMAAVAGLRALLTMGARGRTAVNEVIAAQSALQPHMQLVAAEDLAPAPLRLRTGSHEFVVGLSAVVHAFRTPCTWDEAACLNALRDEDLGVAMAAAFAAAARGTSANATLPALLELRERMPAGSGKALPHRTYRAGEMTFTAKTLPHLRHLLSHAIVAVDPACPAAVPVHIARLEDADAKVRFLAAQQLGRIGADARSALPALASAARDPDLKLAREAVTAIGTIGIESPAARRVLQIAARSADAQLAARAKTALAQLDRAAPQPGAGKK
jgi:hypothetical protein